MTPDALATTIEACKRLIERRFPGGAAGAAAVLLADGSIVTGTSPDFANSSTTVCHEVEPYCAAYRLDQAIVASVCLYRTEEGRFIVLSPCGICRERLADHGPRVQVAIAEPGDPTVLRWISLREALPHYWLTALPEEAGDWVA
ncbi:cytidine deaminase [Agromyces laixinhei]|uniref:cytidine deaminase n=1 Tax=Agromyces laixinhei TaxID=2585717 RepID=UPI0011161BD9|nr:cytidine deaminase [Agromyces laixinhei]